MQASLLCEGSCNAQYLPALREAEARARARAEDGYPYGCDAIQSVVRHMTYTWHTQPVRDIWQCLTCGGGRQWGPVVVALVLVLGLSMPAAAGPILETATAKAADVSLAQAAPAAPVYAKGAGRKWAEWLGIIGGGLMMATVEETCLGQFCKTEWSTSVGGAGLGILAASVVSKALPDPD